MSRDATTTTAFKPPKDRSKTREHLERLVDQYSDVEGLAPARVRRWISTMALLGALEDGGHEGAPSFIVKGGVAMELRLRLRARATKDLDLVFLGDAGRGDRAAIVQALCDALDGAFEGGYSGFTFRRKGEPEAIRDTGSYRLEVALDYAGRSWQTIQIEASPPEGGSDLSELVGLIDLQLLQELVVDLGSVRAACHETFNGRARQAWPPQLDVQPRWDSLYERAARNLEFPVTNVDDAADHVRAFIAAIDAAK